MNKLFSSLTLAAGLAIAGGMVGAHPTSLAAMPGATLGHGPAAAKAQIPSELKRAACGWYVISGCYKSWGSANKRANKIGGYVVNTSSGAYPNFRPGYFCAVFGPYGYSTAKSKSKYIKPSYIKNGC